jgi:hypothetical protein
MRFMLALLIPLLAFPSLATAQLVLSDSSRLNNPAYVQTQIREIGDRDLWNALDLTGRGLGGVRNAAQTGRFADAYKSWGSYWSAKSQPVYLTRMDHLLLDTDMLTDAETFREAMHQAPEERDSILARAEMIMQNTIRVWGDSVIRFGPQIDFNRRVGQSGIYGFHYWIWSRPLLMAWAITGDQKYLEKFDRLFAAWYDQRNSITRTIPDFDVVYYELGLGLRNRMFIEYYLLSSAGRSSGTHERMLKTALGAGRWLYELQRCEGYRPGNWQVHGSYMLVQLALVFPEFRESPEWLHIGLQRMLEHLDRDFYADGGHSERSPRNYTLATYFTYRNLAYLLSRYDTRSDVVTRIRGSMGRTIDWWITMLTPTGEIPAINDSHRGLFPTLVLRDGAALFGTREVHGILRDLFGEQEADSASLPEFTSRFLPASGFSIMRSAWKPDALYLSVNHGPFAGFHSHNDLLDFELYASGTPLAVDAGLGITYDDPLYIPWYKSSRAHNMVVVNDSDMQREGVEGERLRWGSLASIDFFSGEHRGYQRFGVHHRRQIAFVKDSYWFVLDDLSCSRSGDTLSWYFHSPGPLRPAGPGFVSASSPGIRILPAGPALSTRTGKGWAASSSVRIPGRTEEIPWIRFDRISVRDSSSQFAVLLTPFRHQSPEVSVQKISEGHFTVTSAGSVDHLYFANGHFLDGRIETDGMFLLLRERDGLDVGFAVVDGTFLKHRGRTLWHSSTPASGEGTLSRTEIE